MPNTSQILLSRSALLHNLQFIKDIIGPDTMLSSVVKGNAYGHGIEPFVGLAQECGITHFSVFSASEAERAVRILNNKASVMIMGMLDDDQIEWAIRNGVSFFVFDIDRLQKAAEIAKSMATPAQIHLEIETGMNRTGFSTKIFPRILKYVKSEIDNLVIKGMCTHFAGAESIANYHRIKRQESIYKRAYNRMLNFGLEPETRHTACSAALLRYPKSRLDMVRVGILQYGFFPSKEILIHYLTKSKRTDYPLKRMITWKSKIMSVKSVKTGDFIGYGTSFLANSDMKIATIPVGYSNGFSRSLSNQGRVLIHEQRVSVIGTVNMNMITVDVSNLGGVNKGDEVVLIGRQGDLEISVASFSDFSDQLNYEMLTRLPEDIPRIVTE